MYLIYAQTYVIVLDVQYIVHDSCSLEFSDGCEGFFTLYMQVFVTPHMSGLTPLREVWDLYVGILQVVPFQTLHLQLCSDGIASTNCLIGSGSSG